jgi:NAD+--dinitrogen-reductase ADP-D-ribosyltransferase
MSPSVDGSTAINDLESRLDLLYTYCQYELLLAHPEETRLSLYRGINRMDEHEILETLGRNRYRVLLNIFSSTR